MHNTDCMIRCTVTRQAVSQPHTWNALQASSHEHTVKTRPGHAGQAAGAGQQAPTPASPQPGPIVLPETSGAHTTSVVLYGLKITSMLTSLQQASRFRDPEAGLSISSEAGTHTKQQKGLKGSQPSMPAARFQLSSVLCSGGRAQMLPHRSLRPRQQSAGCDHTSTRSHKRAKARRQAQEQVQARA